MTPVELGEVIRGRRKVLGVDQRTAASLAGISIHTMSNIESGKGNPTLTIVTRLLDVLGLELTVKPYGPTG